MKNLKTILVVDVEATCVDSNNGEEFPPGQETEIIEIGICELDLRTFERSQKTSILITPVRSKVTEFCTRLTTLTQAQLDADGVPYRTACESVTELFKAHNKPWGSWGAYDRTMFEREAARRTMGRPERGRDVYPWSPHHTNLKQMMSLVMGRFDGEYGMIHACAVAGLEPEGTHHRGHDDAWNIAGIAAWVLKRTRPLFVDALAVPHPGVER